MVSFPQISLLLTSLAIGSLAKGEEIDFNRDVRPILNKNCTACHGGVKEAGGVSFIIREQALAIGDSGEPTVLPYKADESELMRRILLPGDDDEAMPPEKHHPERLSDEDVATLRQWINEGAVWGDHWSFLLPESPEIPAKESFPDSEWAQGPLDLLVLDKMTEAGLTPNEEAEPSQLLRRMSFALTGLPPTKEEIADFDGERLEETVDELLSRESFGENWGAIWLDLARYADSMGYEKDILRVMWPYRDWVVEALNKDLPYDQFLIKQLAGDLLPDATLSDHVATGFLRNSQTNTEGGTDDEEFRVEALVDRIGTTWTAVQGLTFQCIQCHSHPYDPFPHEEFFEFAAYFNNVKDADLRNDFPTLKVPTDPAENDVALRLHREKEALETEILEPFHSLAEATTWRPALPTTVWTNRTQAKLRIQEVDGHLGVLATGNVAQKSDYRVTFEPAEAPDTVTALRVSVPMPEDKSNHTPEEGFVVHRWQVRVYRGASVEPEKVPISYVASDEANGLYSAPKWGAFPNQFYDREAVLILKRPLALQAGDRIELVMKQNEGRDGAAPPVLRRFYVSFSGDKQWVALVGKEHKTRLATRASLIKELKAIPGVKLPVLAERAVFPREMAVFNRGNFLDKTTVVKGGTPRIFPKQLKGGTRLDMARWMASENNPLTARVMVNRVWARLFGAGIVETAEDFGSTGLPPSNPELLDYLALRFQNEHEWSLKSLIREIVLSATFNQSAVSSEKQRAIDPTNRLLSRGPRQRLTAEMVRDHALRAAGVLNESVGGKPVMPPQPSGIWKAAYSKVKWTDAAEGHPNRYRRALYTFWRRGSPYPSFQIFDAPERRSCSARRITTNTPLQALITLNDPVYHESSRILARELASAGGTVASQIEEGYLRLTSQNVDEEALEILVGLYEELLADFTSAPEESVKVADSPAAAAMVVVCNTLLNLDKSLTW